MQLRSLIFFFVFLSTAIASHTHAKPTIPRVETGFERLVKSEYFLNKLKGKRVGLLTHRAAITSSGESTLELALKRLKLCALFAPEHGIDTSFLASAHVPETTYKNLKVYSLHGAHRAPTDKMLQSVDVIIFDLQDIGSRSYTYLSTLIYLMEKAAKHNVEVIVADRPNPLSGELVDGPMLEKPWRSFVGSMQVPYCHGMTLGELARLYNQTQKIGCKLTISPMKGWKRSMFFSDTGLVWIPTSPNIPEADTSLYYPMTGILGELHIVNIGIGSQLPFKIVTAPWINSADLCDKMQAQNLKGIQFFPYSHRPQLGSFKGQLCHGILLRVTNPKQLEPTKVQFLILSLIKSLYPEVFEKNLAQIKSRREMFCKVLGSEKYFNCFLNDKHPGWKLINMSCEGKDAFINARKAYLISSYED